MISDYVYGMRIVNSDGELKTYNNDVSTPEMMRFVPQKISNIVSISHTDPLLPIDIKIYYVVSEPSK